MELGAFLKKEWFQFRRNITILLIVLVVLPGAAALGTAAYQKTIPEDIPVGVTPENDDVTEEELSVVQAGTAIYASPVRYDSPDEARVALEREDVYLVLVIPDGAFDEGEDVTVTVVSDQRVTPFQEPANYTVSALDSRLDESLPADVSVEHERIGIQHTLSEYLVPTALMMILILYAFVYFPLELNRERDVFERVELTSRIETAVTAKIGFHAALLVVPLTMFQLVSLYLDYRIVHFSPRTIFIIGVTFVYLASISGMVMFASKLRRRGIFVNVGLIAGVFALSSFVYPIGFFSSVRKTIASSLPTYHSMVMIRSTMMKGTPLSIFSPRVELLVLFAFVTVLFLRSSVTYYRRTR